MIPGTAIHPQAVHDAEEIFAYLAKNNVAAARRFNEAVADTLIALREPEARYRLAGERRTTH